MLKIIHIIPTFELGGVQTGIVHSLSGLRKKYDYKVLVIGRIDWDWMNSLPAEIRENTIWTNTQSIPVGWFRAYKIIRKADPDIIISSLWKSAPLTVTYKWLNQKIKLIGFFHTARYVHWINHNLLKLVARTADISITDSGATTEFIRKKYSPSGAIIIPYYFPEDHQYEKHKSPDPLVLRIAYFGRFKPEKGISRALRFSKILKDEDVSLTFDLFGEGLSDRYHKEIHDLGVGDHVKLKNLLPPQEVKKAMRGYDFFLQLSDNEGMGLAVAEAMNCGLVPIVTPVGEIANYSKDGFNAIWLERDFDEKLPELANKLKRIMQHPSEYERLSENARKAFQGKAGYVESMAKVIDELSENGRVING